MAGVDVLLNDFKRQWEEAAPRVLAATERVGHSGWLILGKEVTHFESQLAAQLGVRHVVGCANGLDAIEIGLRVLGLKPGDRVLTTPLSAFATTLAILRAGGVPEFVDVDESGLIDLDAAEKVFSQTDGPRFFLPVHLYGHALNLSRLQELRERFDLKIVEDCAQSVLAKSAGQMTGTVGQVAATSFYPTKNLGCMGDGGAFFTSSQTHADLARSLRDYGQSEKYLHQHLGLNSRLDEIQAAILSEAFLPGLAAATSTRRRIAETYRTEIRNLHMTLPPEPEDSQSVWHLFPVVVDQGREAFRQHLSQNGVQNAVHYPILIPDQPALNIKGSFPNAQRFARAEVSLPIQPYLTDVQIQHVIDVCNFWKGA